MSNDSSGLKMSAGKYTQNSRSADQLPLDLLVAFLNSKFSEFMSANKLHVEQFPGGASNLTYRLFNGMESVILRRPPSGTKAKSAHDMVREYNVLKQVNPFYKISPRPLLVCEDESVLGEKFFIMQEISGLGINKSLPVDMDELAQQSLCNNFVESLVELHNIDISHPDIAKLGKPKGYVERQLTGWYTRYNKVLTDDVPKADSIYAWLNQHLPLESGLTAFIHNDFKFDNLILDKNNPEKIIGVLDWEMATLGDPLLDLGCSLAYWVQADDPESLQAIRMMPTHLPGMMTRQQISDQYCTQRELRGINIEPYYIFGLFRLAVIAQQIYYRFYCGQTDNPKFEYLGTLVKILLNRCEQLIKNAK